jgi:hypothetical protein
MYGKRVNQDLGHYFLVADDPPKIGPVASQPTFSLS